MSEGQQAPETREERGGAGARPDGMARPGEGVLGQRGPATEAGPAGGVADRPENAAPKGLALGGNLRLYPGEPLSKLDRPTASAFSAFDTRAPSRRVFAVVCDEAMPARTSAIPVFSRLQGLPMMRPIDWGVVPWGTGGAERMAIAFEQPSGQPLVRRGANRLRPFRDDELIKRVIEPMVQVLGELESRGIAHRGICAENLYLTNSNSELMVLGESLSAPAGMLQPSIYETIPSAQAQPGGRGAGSMADDLYAFGVLLAVLVRGEYPALARDESAMIAAKIDRGSYAAVVGRTRLSLSLMEPLRGLLADDPGERWGVSELEGWLGGRQMSPKQASIPPKARRSIRFQDNEIWTTRALAHAMAGAWQPALELLRSGEVERWASRSLGDEKRTKAVLHAIGAPGSSGPLGEDRRLARLLVALDPDGPIRLRDFAARVDAFPQALALGLEDESVRRAFAESVNGKLPHDWLNLQSDSGLDFAGLAQIVERQQFFLGRGQPGYGLERIIYEFMDAWPCQSPQLAGRYVDSIADLLPALEARAEKGELGQLEVVDRHIAAFCAAKMKPSPERVLQDLVAEADVEARRRAVLRLLAELQRRHGPASLPHLTAWMGEQIQPLLSSINNRSLRSDLERRAKALVEHGSLPALVQVIDSPDTRAADARAFEAAQREYRRMEHEVAWLRAGGLTSEQHVTRASRSAATAISALVSGLMVMVISLVYLT